MNECWRGHGPGRGATRQQPWGLPHLERGLGSRMFSRWGGRQEEGGTQEGGPADPMLSLVSDREGPGLGVSRGRADGGLAWRQGGLPRALNVAVTPLGWGQQLV